MGETGSALLVIAALGLVLFLLQCRFRIDATIAWTKEPLFQARREDESGNREVRRAA